MSPSPSGSRTRRWQRSSARSQIRGGAPPIVARWRPICSTSPAPRRRAAPRRCTKPSIWRFMPTVSVITPAYNAAAYLAGSVESVLRQTFPDLELLIVDDGSTDNTVAVARQLAARDPRLRVLTQENAGPGPARNTGFRHATGRYFAFVDSDDEWDLTFLAEQVVILEQRPDVDVLICNARNRGGERDGQPTRPVTGAVGERISLGDMLGDE